MPDPTNDLDPQLDPDRSTARSRRDLLRAGSALAAGALGAGLASGAGAAEAGPLRSTRVYPDYFPRRVFTPDLDLTGKFAVVTGASRGIGRATAEALVAQGVTVIGTSRNAAGVPNAPTGFDLLDLDVTSDASVAAFEAALLAHPQYPGRIDVLINNAGRYVVGTITPPPIAPDPTGFYLAQAALGTETLYGGHMRITNRLLPHMAQSDDARLLFTVSSNAYLVGGGPGEAAFGDGILSFQTVYTSAKRALLAYANNLRGFLRASGSAIRVTTVNPYSIRTSLADGLNPVFTEPVDESGNSPFNPVLQEVLDGVRASLRAAPPPAIVGQTYVQLLSMADPPANVAVAQPFNPVYGQGVAFINEVIRAENEEAALQLACRPPDRG